MPITVDLEKNPFLRGMVEHVRKDCTVENIMMVLHARFARLPNALQERLQTLSQDELDRIVVQAATAATLEEAVKVPLISPPATTLPPAGSGDHRKGT